MNRLKDFKFKGLLAGLVVFLVLLIAFIGRFYIPMVWLSSVNYISVFWKILFTQLGVGIFFAALFFILSFINFNYARRYAPAIQIDATAEENERPEMQIYRTLQNFQISKRFVILFSLIISLLMGISESVNWEERLVYLNRVSFGANDPVFGQDIGFYLFSLPFLEYLRNWLSFAIGFILVIVLVVYIVKKAIRFENRKLSIDLPVKLHL